MTQSEVRSCSLREDSDDTSSIRGIAGSFPHGNGDASRGKRVEELACHVLHENGSRGASATRCRRRDGMRGDGFERNTKQAIQSTMGGRTRHARRTARMRNGRRMPARLWPIMGESQTSAVLGMNLQRPRPPTLPCGPRMHPAHVHW